MKKKIAFFLQHQSRGGTERSLISLIKEIPLNKYDMTVFEIWKTGKFEMEMPEGVHIKQLPIKTKVLEHFALGGIKASLHRNIGQHKYLQACMNVKDYLLGTSEFAELNVNFSQIDNMKEEFDVAICYHIHSPFFLRYVSEKVSAKMKIGWIHNDFTTTQYRIDLLEKYVKSYQYFMAVSCMLREEFIEIYPKYERYTLVFPNVIRREELKKKAGKEIPQEYKNKLGIILLTVGRLEKQKGYEIAIEACRKVVQKGFNIYWFVLGEGNEQKRLERLIRKNRVQENFILLGNRINPYPYFRQCDIYVQTSRHEGRCIAVDEAKVLCKPIVCTRVAGAMEQLEDGVNGKIVDISSEGIADAIIDMIKNPEMRKKYEYELMQGNQQVDIEDFLRLLNEQSHEVL